MKNRCYVCETQVDRESALCEKHLAARDHVISMRSEGALCQCGWATDIPRQRYAERDEACRAHWLEVTEGAA